MSFDDCYTSEQPRVNKGKNLKILFTNRESLNQLIELRCFSKTRIGNHIANENINEKSEIYAAKEVETPVSIELFCFAIITARYILCIIENIKEKTASSKYPLNKSTIEVRIDTIWKNIINTSLNILLRCFNKFCALDFPSRQALRKSYLWLK